MLPRVRGPSSASRGCIDGNRRFLEPPRAVGIIPQSNLPFCSTG